MPMTTSSSRYFSSRRLISGMTCMQLMQPYVQKSRRTIFPFRSVFRLSGLGTFSQSTAPVSSGAWMGSLLANREEVLVAPDVDASVRDCWRRVNRLVDRIGHLNL